MPVLLEVEDLHTEFDTAAGSVHAERADLREVKDATGSRARGWSDEDARSMSE